MGRLQPVKDFLKIDSKSLQLLQERDEAFITTLVTDLNPGLYRLLLWQGIPADHAAELLQATWATFVETCTRFEGRSAVRTFISGILLNKVREWKRIRLKLKPEEDLETLLTSTFTKDGWWNKPPPTPLEEIENQDIGISVKSCLEGLTENQRLAFVLKEIEEENTETICNLLNLSRTHLGVLLFRAKEKLRICLTMKSTPYRSPE
jgi:RNA polymerase sigma-70 factor, ECF subfamily